MKTPSLKAQLRDALGTIEYLKQRESTERQARADALHELREVREQYRTDMHVKYQEERDKTTLLFEIIRWQINPETAKDPFNKIERVKDNLPPRY